MNKNIFMSFSSIAAFSSMKPNSAQLLHILGGRLTKFLLRIDFFRKVVYNYS